MDKINAFPYIGGKSFLMDKIIDIIPPCDIFLEPFCGGASVLLNKPPSGQEIMNDISEDIIDFFKTCRDNFQELYHYLEHIPYHRGLYYELISKWKQGWRPSNKIEKVAYWHFIQSASFSGKFGGWFRLSKTDKNQAEGFYNAVEGLHRVRDRLRKVVIENRDYEEVMRYYDGENTVGYIDPPYMVERVGQYYKDGSDFDHIRLAEVLNSLKSKIILSYYPHPDLDILYKGWKRDEYDMPKTSFGSNVGADESGTRPRGTELILTNFEVLPLFRFAKGEK